MTVALPQMHNSIVHTYERIFQVTRIGRNLQGIETIHISDGAHLRVINTDTDAGKGFTSIIFHHATHRTGAGTGELTGNRHDIPLYIVGAVNTVHHLVEHLSHRTVLSFYRHFREGLCQFCTVDKVQPRLFLHFRKELLHGHLRHVKCHGLILHRLRCHVECQHRHQQDNDHSLRCFDSFHSLTFLC